MKESSMIEKLLKEVVNLLKVKHLQKKEGSVLVSRTRLSNLEGKVVEEVSKEQKIRARVFLSTPATVSYSFGRTISRPNYESIKFGVMVTAPCYPEEVAEFAPQVEAVAEELMERLFSKTSSPPKKLEESKSKTETEKGGLGGVKKRVERHSAAELRPSAGTAK